MPAKVFISCGQASEEERAVARRVADLLRQTGFNPYVAIEGQSIEDVNSGIIDQLKSSDYYLFIDFCRETIGTDQNNQPVFRGSLFTHQELALAYVFDFPSAIFLRQKGTELNGLSKYLLANAKEFEQPAQAVGFVEMLVQQRKWSPDYSRHLVVLDFNRLSEPKWDGDFCKYEWFALIKNARTDLTARHVVARLMTFSDRRGMKVELTSRVREPLDWLKSRDFLGTFFAEFETQQQVDLLPGQSNVFSAFSICAGSSRKYEKYDERCLHLGFISQLTLEVGQYRARYQVLADNVPPLEFDVEINITGKAETTTARLCK